TLPLYKSPLFGVAGSEQPFSVSSVTSVPSAFPVMAHPAFSLLSPATVRPEFGGLGALGVTAALAAHPQLGAFSGKWWRAAEAHGRSSAAFFPPFLGLPPLFAPPLQNHEATPYTSKTPSKSSRGSIGGQRKHFPSALCLHTDLVALRSLLSQDQEFPLQLKKQQELYKPSKRSGTESSSSPSLLSSTLLPLKPSSGRTKPPAAQGAAPSPGLLLSQTLLGLSQANGVIQSVPQDVPLALTTKSHTDLPVNLSTGGRKDALTSPTLAPTSATPQPGRPRNSRKSKTPKPLEAWKEVSQNHLVQSLVDVFHHGRAEQELPGSKDSDDSAEDDDDDEDDDVDDEEEDEEDSDDSLSGMELWNGQKLEMTNYSSQILMGLLVKTVWRRETRVKTVGGRLQGDVAYYAPCGKRLRQYPDVVKGLQWILLSEDEVVPRIRAMEGRRGRPPNTERQQRGADGESSGSGSRRRKGRPPNVGQTEFPSPSEAKLLRKLEAQEIARQAAQMKLMRKLEKQALARAAKEARKQQAIMAAEERRKQKEQIKILKQQEKIKRIQQIRMEKELRAQQILEAKRKKREEAANAKILEAEKRLKVSERERRRQHVMLMKAVEARKKAEERERLKQEKRDEKRLNKERKLELRRLELEMIREMKKPNEDMCLTDHKPLPEFSRIPGLVLPGQVFSDCLMVVQFLRSFGKVLDLELSEVPTLGVLQEGLLNLGNSMGQVQDLLVRLLSSAVCDPGLPPGQRTKSILGDHLTNVGLNRDNVSEVLQQYMEAHCSQTDLADIALSLKTKAFQAHTPAQKASILAFLVNELACSKCVVSGSNMKSSLLCSLFDFLCIVEELEKQIDKLSKQQNLIRRKLFESSHALRSMTYGQDRYRRRYWVLPQCGGVFIEGLESGEGPEELEKEREMLQNFEAVQVKEEPQEELQPQEVQSQVKQEEDPLLKESPNMALEVTALCHNSNGCPATVAPVATSARSPNHSTSKPMVLCSVPVDPMVPVPQFGVPLPPQFGVPPSLQQQQAQLFSNDQLLRVLTERSGHWFSLLPRSPCDDSSLTQPPTPPSPVPPCSPHHHLNPSASPSPLNPAHDGAGNHTMSPLQVKPVSALMALPMCGWSGGVISPNLPVCSSPLPLYPPVEGSASPLLAPSVSTSKSGSPAPPGDKPPSAPSPAIDLPRNHDHPQPHPIPEDMLMGWWKVADVEELQALMKALHSRGIRERSLQKQIQKSMELIAQTCNKNKEVSVMEVSELDEGQVSVETLQEWCVEEQAMETDIALLQQVEELERKVTSASLQVKGWVHPEPQSEREDLVYHEHKPLPKSRQGAESQDERSSEKGLSRRPSNPLDIAVSRLAELERHIERRYLRSPLGTTIQIRLDNVGTVTVPAPAPSTSAGGEGGEEELAPGMKVWRKALSEVRNSSQLAMCLQQLQKSIAWERSIMKVYCQICRKGDNEDLLLLCDGCDKGCHTYCHKPKISTIPEGDWYCPACISKAQNRVQSGGGGKKSAETAKKNKKQPEVCGEEEAVGGGSSSSSNTSNSSPKKAATASTQTKKMFAHHAFLTFLPLCRILLAELERHQDAWPFLTPVNLKSVPGYRKVIKKPMDFSTIREKLVSSQYQNLETFIIDVNLVFDNCEKFNEDNSDIGRAGHNMRKFFEKRWTELLKQTN
uniref:Bromodomain adjacent to zinc finger domain, 2Ba n=1 Tax=Pygocentrus nattereri TaxID=42514 RepID=A0AAR2KHL6_PYGNA